MAILPEHYVLFAIGVVLVILITLLIILKGIRSKNSVKRLDRRVSAVKKQFNDIKDESIDYEEDDWLKMRLNGDSDD